MATVKISELPSAQDIGAADEVLVVQDGKTCKAKASALRAYLTGGFELQNLSVTPTETQQTFGPANGVCYEKKHNCELLGADCYAHTREISDEG